MARIAATVTKVTDTGMTAIAATGIEIAIARPAGSAKEIATAIGRDAIGAMSAAIAENAARSEPPPKMI